MMKKAIPIPICLLLVVIVTACTSFGESQRDAEATEIAAQAPTATPIASPTPTWTPTPTPTPTPPSTLTPTTFPLPHGWIDYGSGDFHLALPESWEVVDVDQEGMEVILDLLE